MKQSNLIEIFSNARKNIADNFHLVNLTSKHLWPNMKLTHDILARHVREYEHNVECSGGRATEYQVPDLFQLGVSELLEKKFSDGLGIPEDSNGTPEDGDSADAEASKPCVEEEDLTII